MTDQLVVEGVKPWDGSYDFDLLGNPLTYREWEWITGFSGYMPLTIDEGYRGGDPRLFRAFAVVALHRAGRIAPADAADLYERFADLPFGGTIRLQFDERGAEVAEAEDPSTNQAAKPNGSGHGLRLNSGLSGDLPRERGMPVSATSESRQQG